MGTTRLTAAILVAVTAAALSGCGKALEELGAGAKPIIEKPPRPPVDFPTMPVELPRPLPELPGSSGAALGTPAANPHPWLTLAEETLPAIRAVPRYEDHDVLEFACRIYDFDKFVSAQPDGKWLIVAQQFHLPAAESHEIAEVASEIRELIVHPTWRNGLTVTPQAICLAGDARDGQP